MWASENRAATGSRGASCPIAENAADSVSFGMAGLHPILTRFDRLRTGRPGPAAGAFYRSTARIGARLLVAEDGEALLEGQLEPVAARDAVARPVVEVLVRNHPLHPLEVGVGGCAPRAPATPVRPGRPAPKAGELSLEPRKPCKYKQCGMFAMPVHRQTKKDQVDLKPVSIPNHAHGDASCAAHIARRPSLSGSGRPRPLGAPVRPRTVGVPVSVCMATRRARPPISPQSCMDGEGCVCVRVCGGPCTRLGLGEDARGVEDVEALVLHRCRAQAQRGHGADQTAAGAARGRAGAGP